jgi:hypothetical protein
MSPYFTSLNNAEGPSGRQECLHHPKLDVCSLATILKNWKGFTARIINEKLARQGSLWMDESFEHAVRSETQLRRFKDYIRENPSKAGLGEHEASVWLGGEMK